MTLTHLVHRLLRLLAPVLVAAGPLGHSAAAPAPPNVVVLLPDDLGAHEPKPLAQQADGSFLLHARDAAIHGTTLRYEPQPFKDTLGWWTHAEDWASWQVAIERPATFEVEVWQGCGKGQGGSDVMVEVVETKLPFTVLETGHFQIFVLRRIGRVTFASPGIQTVALKPQRKQAVAVMDVRQVRLLPVDSAKDAPPAAKSSLEARRLVFPGDGIEWQGRLVINYS